MALLLILGAKLIYASISSLSASVYGEIFNYIIAHINRNSLILNILMLSQFSELLKKYGCGKSRCVCKILFTCAGATWSSRASRSCAVPVRSCMLPNAERWPPGSSRRKTLKRSARTARDFLNDVPLWARAATERAQHQYERRRLY